MWCISLHQFRFIPEPTLIITNHLISCDSITLYKTEFVIFWMKRYQSSVDLYFSDQTVVPIVNSLNTQKLEFIHPKFMFQAFIVILTTDWHLFKMFWKSRNAGHLFCRTLEFFYHHVFFEIQPSIMSINTWPSNYDAAEEFLSIILVNFILKI